MQFHHVGLIVDDIEKGKKFFDSLMSNLIWSEVFDDLKNGVSVAFGTGTDGICYELIVPFGTYSPVSNYLLNKQNMIHHIAYSVEDFEKKCAELRQLKLVPLGDPKPAVAFKGKKVAFFLTPIKTIIELIEK